MVAPNFIFTPFAKKDIPLMLQWLRLPHVLQFWPEQLTNEEIFKKYLKHIQSDWVFPFLAKYKEIPFAYIQAYQSWKEGNGWWPDQMEGTYGLDLFIAQEEYLGQGLGTAMLKNFIHFFSKNHQVKKWIIDVDPSNSRAWRCYEKVGFNNIGTVDTPEGEVLLLELSVTKN